MPSRVRSLALLLAGALLLSLAGCFGSNGNGASFTLGVKDTPVDGANSVVIDFTGVDLMGPNGMQSFTFPGGWPTDPLQNQGSMTAVLLNNYGIEPGNYQWIQLNIDPSKSYLIASDGNQYPLNLASGSSTGLKIANTFTATKGGDANFVIEFNLRNSITESNSSGTPVYTLNPSLQLIPVVKTGFIKGTVAPTLTVGGTVQKGFEQGAFDRALDIAGYPKTGRMPPRNQAAPSAPTGTDQTSAPVEEEQKPLGPYAPRFSTEQK